MDIKKYSFRDLNTLFLITLLSCGQGGGSPVATAPVTGPLSIPNPVITYDTCTEISWDAAESTDTPQDELQYAVYSAADPADISTVENLEANGTVVMDYTADTTSLSYSGVGDDVNVIVKDNDGNKAVYTQFFADDCCFVGETLITMANGEVKRIDQIKEGDELMGFDSQHKLSISKVMGVGEHKIPAYLHVKTTEGEFKVTGGHFFYTGEKSNLIVPFHQRLDQFAVGSYLSVLKDQRIMPSKILSMTTKKDEVTVYFIHLIAEHNTYFANGFATLDA